MRALRRVQNPSLSCIDAARCYAAITEAWNSDDVGARYLLSIGPQLEQSALLRVEVSFSFGG